LPSSHSIARRSAAPGAPAKEKTTKDAIGTDGARIAKQHEATHKATAFKLDPKMSFALAAEVQPVSVLEWIAVEEPALRRITAWSLLIDSLEAGS
jgi:hypothetical protein